VYTFEFERDTPKASHLMKAALIAAAAIARRGVRTLVIVHRSCSSNRGCRYLNVR
jgi:hypothetical protein